MTRQALRDLAARCEAATGADRELDAAIGSALWVVKYGKPLLGVGGCYHPPYTASLDAAMSLVPEGCDWILNSRRNYAQVWERKGVGAQMWAQMWECKSAATPALALTAACLKALAQENEP